MVNTGKRKGHLESFKSIGDIFISRDVVCVQHKGFVVSYFKPSVCTSHLFFGWMDTSQ